MAMLSWSNLARAQDDAAFHEMETKYIFKFYHRLINGHRGRARLRAVRNASQLRQAQWNYAAGQTALEYEYTPNQYVQIELGPTVSYYNIRGVAGLDDASRAAVNGFESDFRFVILDRNPSPFAVTLSVEPEVRSRDETSGVKVQNYELEAKLEADTELIKNRLFLGFNLLYEPETTLADLGSWYRNDYRAVLGAGLPDRAERRHRRRPLVSAPL